MLFNKRNKLIACGVIAMALALATTALNYPMQGLLCFVRALQLTATVALLFGILKKETLHKDKFLLFWMAITTILFTSLGYCGLYYFTIDFFGNDFDTRLQVALVLWPATALVGYLLYYAYQEYVEFGQSSSVAAAPVMHEINAFWKTKEQPPQYVVPTTGDPVLSV